MSLLTIINNVADRLAIPRVTAVIAATDQQTRTLLGLANEEGKTLAARYQWEVLNKECLFQTIADEDQGPITTIAPGFKRFLNWTFWNRGIIIPILNITPQEWQQLKASNITGPFPEFRLRSGNLLMLPQPGGDETMAFEYVSKNWVRSSDGLTTYDQFQADSNETELDSFIIESGIRWRFLRQKGMDYAQEYADYERLVADAIGNDGASPNLRADGHFLVRGVGVAPGNWTGVTS